MLQHVQSDIIHIFVCLEKGGVCYFSHPDGGGGRAILSSRNRGGQHFFSDSEALSAPPPLKFMDSPEVVLQDTVALLRGIRLTCAPSGECLFSALPCMQRHTVLRVSRSSSQNP